MAVTPEEELPKRAILRAVQQNETGRARYALNIASWLAV
jgi:hypothetical protein